MSILSKNKTPFLYVINLKKNQKTPPRLLILYSSTKVIHFERHTRWTGCFSSLSSLLSSIVICPHPLLSFFSPPLSGNNPFCLSSPKYPCALLHRVYKKKEEKKRKRSEKNGKIEEHWGGWMLGRVCKAVCDIKN